MRTPFALSHHVPADYHRCVQLCGLQLCARCLGVYPTMFLGIAAQVALRAPLELPGDIWIAAVLPIPALVDWARGRFDPRTGTNASRLLTGMMLGASLARTIYLHLRHPGFALTMAQMAALALTFLGVETAARLRRRRTDRKQGPDVSDSNRDGSGP